MTRRPPWVQAVVFGLCTAVVTARGNEAGPAPPVTARWYCWSSRRAHRRRPVIPRLALTSGAVGRMTLPRLGPRRLRCGCSRSSRVLALFVARASRSPFGHRPVVLLANTALGGSVRRCRGGARRHSPDGPRRRAVAGPPATSCGASGRAPEHEYGDSHPPQGGLHTRAAPGDRERAASSRRADQTEAAHLAIAKACRADQVQQCEQEEHGGNPTPRATHGALENVESWRRVTRWRSLSPPHDSLRGSATRP